MRIILQIKNQSSRKQRANREAIPTKRTNLTGTENSMSGWNIAATRGHPSTGAHALDPDSVLVHGAMDERKLELTEPATAAADANAAKRK